jgi:hypothetical protein
MLKKQAKTESANPSSRKRNNWQQIKVYSVVLQIY